MSRILNLGLPKFSRNLVTWDSKQKKIVNQSYFRQILHRIVNLTRPGHFERTLGKSIKEAYLQQVKNEKQGTKKPVARFSATPESKANEIKDLVMLGKTIDAQAIKSTIEECAVLERRVAINRNATRASGSRRREGKVSEAPKQSAKAADEITSLEKELNSLYKLGATKMRAEAKIPSDPSYAKVKQLREKIDYPGIQLRNVLTREINNLNQVRDDLNNEYDQIFTEQMRAKEMLTSQVDPERVAQSKEKIDHLQNELDDLATQEQSVTNAIKAKLTEIDKLHRIEERSTVNFKSGNYQSVNDELLKLNLPVAATIKEDILFEPYRKQIARRLGMLVKLQPFIDSAEKYINNAESRKILSQTAKATIDYLKNFGRGEEAPKAHYTIEGSRLALKELKAELIAEVKQLKKEMQEIKNN